MIKRILLISIAVFLFYGQSSWAENQKPMARPGNFFNISTYVNTLTINTVTPNWTYRNAGIKVLTPGYTVANINPTNNGYYLFSVSDTVAASITLVGVPGTVSIQLCLSGLGSGANCEIKTVALTKQKYAYAASGFNGEVYKCSVTAHGHLQQCGALLPSSGAPGWIPESITFTTVNGIQYAYVASWTNGGVYQCTLNSDGSLGICHALTPTGTVYTYAAGITFATINGTQYAYVSDDVANVYQCNLSNDGTFSSCNPLVTSGSLGWIPVSTTFASVSGVQYAYVASDNGHVYQCSLLTNGTFNTCNVIVPTSGEPSWLPKAVTFSTFSGYQYAYVSDDHGNVFQCGLNSVGGFNLCSATPDFGIPDWSPRSVSFETFGGTQYAYVANFGTAISLFGSIDKCTLNAQGKFTDCVASPALDIPNWGNLWWVTFH